ncbi:MAG TPA: A/G-specific adenine glycosylase [Verrucomicrobiae bacterium]|nr:A/G-specific adenine glycosylase [Verrucomicrobiae bacterium]
MSRRKHQSDPIAPGPAAGEIVSLQLEWFGRTARDLPWRRTRDPYAIWVSEIMLQQTQVKTVIPYWERWMRDLPDVQSLAAANPDRVHKLWEGLGYYTRVRNMQKAAQVVMARHGGVFPRKFDDVLELPGIGRYTAGAICSIAFQHPRPILDGNVVRVLTRLFAIGEDPREKQTNARLWDLAALLVAAAGSAETKRGKLHPVSAFNQSLMELGALICTPRTPRCDDCPLRHRCLALRTSRVHELPNLGERMRITPRRFAAFVVRKRNHVLVRQRPAGVVNAHLWEFPNVELEQGSADVHSAGRGLLGFVPEQVASLCTIRHSITRYRITLDAYVTCWNAKSGRVAGTWKTLEQLDELAFTSAHRRIVKLMQRAA